MERINAMPLPVPDDGESEDDTEDSEAAAAGVEAAGGPSKPGDDRAGPPEDHEPTHEPDGEPEVAPPPPPGRPPANRPAVPYPGPPGYHAAYMATLGGALPPKAPAFSLPSKAPPAAPTPRNCPPAPRAPPGPPIISKAPHLKAVPAPPVISPRAPPAPPVISKAPAVPPAPATGAAAWRGPRNPHGNPSGQANDLAKPAPVIFKPPSPAAAAAPPRAAADTPQAAPPRQEAAAAEHPQAAAAAAAAAAPPRAAADTPQAAPPTAALPGAAETAAPPAAAAEAAAGVAGLPAGLPPMPQRPPPHPWHRAPPPPPGPPPPEALYMHQDPGEVARVLTALAEPSGPPPAMVPEPAWTWTAAAAAGPAVLRPPMALDERQQRPLGPAEIRAHRDAHIQQAAAPHQGGGWWRGGYTTSTWNWAQQGAWNDTRESMWGQGGGEERPRGGRDAVPQVEGDAAMPAAQPDQGPRDGWRYWPDSRDPRRRWVPLESWWDVPSVPQEVRQAPSRWRLVWAKLGDDDKGPAAKPTGPGTWGRPVPTAGAAPPAAAAAGSCTRGLNAAPAGSSSGGTAATPGMTTAAAGSRPGIDDAALSQVLAMERFPVPFWLSPAAVMYPRLARTFAVMAGWTAGTAVVPDAVEDDNDDTAAVLRHGNGGDGEGWEADAGHHTPVPDPATEGVDESMATQVEAEVHNVAAAAENVNDAEEDQGRPESTSPPPLPRTPADPHGRGRVIIEACAEHICPPPQELARRVFVYDMRKRWQKPDSAAGKAVREGHTGQNGVILRAIAFHQAWGSVVAAARRACNRAWWQQLSDGAQHGFEPIRLTIICQSGRHRSVAAAYLLAAALEQEEGAVGAEVSTPACKPCGCPYDCRLHRGGRGREEARMCHDRAVAWTCQLMRADARLMPRAQLV